MTNKRVETCPRISICRAAALGFDGRPTHLHPETSDPVCPAKDTVVCDRKLDEEKMKLSCDNSSCFRAHFSERPPIPSTVVRLRGSHRRECAKEKMHGKKYGVWESTGSLEVTF